MTATEAIIRFVIGAALTLAVNAASAQEAPKPTKTVQVTVVKANGKTLECTHLRGVSVCTVK